MHSMACIFNNDVNPSDCCGRNTTFCSDAAYKPVLENCGHRVTCMLSVQAGQPGVRSAARQGDHVNGP